MLALASMEIQQAGLANVETQVMDAANLQLAEESFEAVICRGGLEFVPEPLKALAGMRRAAKAGKRVGIIVFSDPDKCPHVSIPAAIVRQPAQVAPPPPGAPGLFSLARPGRLQALVEQAGFRDVTVLPVTRYLHLPSAAECVRFAQAVGGPLVQMLAGLGDAQRQAVWQEVEHALRPYEGPSGFDAPCELLAAVGTR